MTPAPLALTMGDPAGIGAEIALAAWASGRVRQPFALI
ncbi:MAG: 4-hydroxythreonine-4-phosphate dehydrogenase, partial [Pseudomonadota bacterium]